MGRARSAPSFRDIRTIVTADGFLVQGNIDGVVGGAGRTHIVQILKVSEGRIDSCEEYIAPEMALTTAGDPVSD